MNRRGFLGLVTAAAVAPQELIRPVAPAPVLDAAAAGSAYSRVLAQSLLQTKEMIAANILNQSFGVYGSAAWRVMLKPGLEKEFEELYAEPIPWEELYQETLAGEVGSGDSSVQPWWEETGRTSENLTAESR